MFTFQRVGLGKHFDPGKVSDVVQDRTDSCMNCFTYERPHITAQGRHRPICRPRQFVFETFSCSSARACVFGR